MARLTLDIDDRIINAVAAARGWTATVPDPANPGDPFSGIPPTMIPNPVTRPQFVTQYIRTLLRTMAIDQETAVDEKAARERIRQEIPV